MNDLQATEQSTRNLYSAFFLRPSQQATISKFAEESYEFIDALRHDDDAHILEEAADVIVTILGALSVRGLGADDLSAALAYVRKKNGDKTDVTHEVRDGMIVKKDKIR